MNPCPEYESQILDYAELAETARASLDAHIASCADCSQFFAALNEVDDVLADAFPAGVELPAAAVSPVLRQADRPPAKPSLVPELFDLIGWASLLAVLVMVAEISVPSGFRPAAVWAVFTLTILAGSAWFVLQGWREMGAD